MCIYIVGCRFGGRPGSRTCLMHAGASMACLNERAALYESPYPAPVFTSSHCLLSFKRSCRRRIKNPRATHGEERVKYVLDPGWSLRPYAKMHHVIDQIYGRFF